MFRIREFFYQSSCSCTRAMMVSLRFDVLAICCIFILGQSGNVESGWFGDLAGKIVNSSSKALQDPVTQALCNLKTDELIRYYGYEPEVHEVVTDDGYILTVFRCNSKNSSLKNKKPVILKHGISCSSDEFCELMPGQGLAYVMADAGYDVWMPNARGNFYSRQHISKNPDDPKSGFWDYSWDSIGLNDYPAVYDYVRQHTNNSKLYVIAHSQGTSATLALLSEKPQYNDYMNAVSLMAPIAYLNHSSSVWRTMAKLAPLLQVRKNREMLPRSTMNHVQGTMCEGIFGKYCDKFSNFLFGQSESQRNETLTPTIMCHNPSGISTNQLMHFAQEIQFGFFGKRMLKFGGPIPQDFPLHQITAPLSIHYSVYDTFTDPKDVNRLIKKLGNGPSDLHIQRISDTVFNHADFTYGIHAAKLVYSDILQFFAKHQ